MCNPTCMGVAVLTKLTKVTSEISVGSAVIFTCTYCPTFPPIVDNTYNMSRPSYNIKGYIRGCLSIPIMAFQRYFEHLARIVSATLWIDAKKLLENPTAHIMGAMLLYTETDL